MWKFRIRKEHFSKFNSILFRYDIQLKQLLPKEEIEIFLQNQYVESETSGIQGFLFKCCERKFLFLDLEGTGSGVYQGEEDCGLDKILFQLYNQVLQYSDIFMLVNRNSNRFETEFINELNQLQEKNKSYKVLINNKAEICDLKIKILQIEQELKLLEKKQEIKFNFQQIVAIPFLDLTKGYRNIFQQSEDGKNISIQFQQLFSNILQNQQQPKSIQLSQEIKKKIDLDIQKQNKHCNTLNQQNQNNLQKIHINQLNLLEIINNNDQYYTIKLNQEAFEIIKQSFNYPIIVITIAGRVGTGKSTLANFLVNQILIEFDQKLDTEYIFETGNSHISVTRGLNFFLLKTKKYHFLIVDLEGLGGYIPEIKTGALQNSYLKNLYSIYGFAYGLSNYYLYTTHDVRIQQKDKELVSIIIDRFSSNCNFQNKVINQQLYLCFNKQNNHNNQCKLPKNKFLDKFSKIFFINYCFDKTLMQEHKYQQILVNQKNNISQDIKHLLTIILNDVEICQTNFQKGEHFISNINSIINILNSNSDAQQQISYSIIKIAQEKQKLIQERIKKLKTELQLSLFYQIQNKYQKILSAEMFRLMNISMHKQLFLYQEQLINKTIKQIVIEQQQDDIEVINLIKNYLGSNQVYYVEQQKQKNTNNNNLEFQKNIPQQQNYIQIQQIKQSQQLQVRIDNIDIRNQNIAVREQIEITNTKWYTKYLFQSKESIDVQDEKQSIQQEQISINNQTKQINQITNLRMEAAFAGIGGSILGQVTANALKGKYKNNKQGLVLDVGLGVGMGGSIIYLSTKVPLIGLVVGSTFIIGQSIYLLSNKYTSKKSNSKEIGILLAKKGSAIVFGVIGAYIGSIIPGVGTVIGGFLGGLIGGYGGTIISDKIENLLKGKILLSANKGLVKFFCSPQCLDQSQFTQLNEILGIKPQVFTEIQLKPNKFYLNQFLFEDEKINPLSDSYRIDEFDKALILALHIICFISEYFSTYSQSNDKDETEIQRIDDSLALSQSFIEKESDIKKFTYWDFNYILYENVEKIFQNYDCENHRNKIISFQNFTNGGYVFANRFLTDFLEFELQVNLQTLKYSIPKEFISSECEDLWLTLLIHQLLDPSFTLQDCQYKIIIYLENKHIFALDYLQEFQKLLESIKSKY